MDTEDYVKAIKSLEVWQGGSNSPSSSMKALDDHNARFWGGAPLFAQSPKAGGVTVSLKHPSKGGGETALNVWFPPTSFSALAMEMMRASPVEATQAFRKALLESSNAA